MTSKELKKLSRSDLMEILLELSRENQELRDKLKAAEDKLNDRRLIIEKSGSLAEAALRLNKIFEDAQAACEQYALSVCLRCEQIEEDTKLKCEEMLRNAQNPEAKTN